MFLTATDQQLLAMLTRVRTASRQQVADHFYGGSTAYAARRLAVLERAGFLQSYMLLAGEPIMTGPLVAWQTRTEPLPDLSHLAYVLSVRWADLELKARKCVILARSYGRSIAAQGTRRSRQAEGTHDLACAAVYLRQSKERQDAWQGEVGHTEHEMKKPDATINLDGVIAVEIGGSSYTEAKLKGLLTWCKERGIVSVELW